MMMTWEGQTKATSQVEAVLEGSASKSDWAAIRRCDIVVVPLTTLTTMLSRDSTSVSSCLGGLCSNDSLFELRHATEPVSQIMS